MEISTELVKEHNGSSWCIPDDRANDIFWMVFCGLDSRPTDGLKIVLPSYRTLVLESLPMESHISYGITTRRGGFCVPQRSTDLILEVCVFFLE